MRSACGYWNNYYHYYRSVSCVCIIVTEDKMLRVISECSVNLHRLSVKAARHASRARRRNHTGEHVTGYPSWMCGSNAAVLSAVRAHVQLLQNFLSEEEEAGFLQELEPRLRRKRYEFDHWDDAIHGFREMERVQWGVRCDRVLERLRTVAFPEGCLLLGPVHILDLDKTGFIKPHVDSVKFCGSTIAGLCLLSDSVMRLVSVENSADQVDLLLQRRSLYILRDDARFKFTHEILKDELSFFSGQRVPRFRRISIICRNLPLQ